MTSPDTIIRSLTLPWKHGEHFDGTGIVLDTPLILDGLTLRGFDLSRAELRGGISAKGAVCMGIAWLRDARIAKGAVCDFSGARCRNDLRMDGITADSIVMQGCRLEGILSLSGARVGRLLLADALVMANLTLEGAEIQTADLGAAEIMGGMAAAGARIGQLHDGKAEISGRIHAAP